MASPSNGNVALPMVQLNHICSPLNPTVEARIAAILWGPFPAQNDYTPEASPRPYFSYYTDQCRTVYYSLGTSFWFITHDAVVDMISAMRQGVTREELVQDVLNNHSIPASSPQFNETHIANAFVDLVARLVLMVEVGPVTKRVWSRRACRSWESGNISSFATGLFEAQSPNSRESTELSSNFNARNLDVIAGLRVELTSNLLDHLQVMDIEGVSTLMVFHHVSFLKNHGDSLFADGFVYETIQTLALLFPQNTWYRDSKAWYHKYLEPTVTDADPGVLSCGPLTMTSLDSYRFWHDRLSRLQQIFDQAKPRTLSQWWNDRREGTQWYALWVAVGLTVFFGLVQSIEGALQVYKAYHPD
ncbi:hypothetical protein VHEMI04077 [[Torrubiella] hemipterigena]|uniref:Uncharacterized protein n=1 Tax=[Torrubiella] hemipterigena TaxID=1531966 RepID=A0A0A1T0A5_9HYPO|nr:hypothetical protein VHEMI04077 [[Torrubiella] hemipterigena]